MIDKHVCTYTLLQCWDFLNRKGGGGFFFKKRHDMFA